jgi:hypothetical protein
MNQKNLDKELQILVLSYDGFKDLWPVFFHYFFEMWPDCPFKVNLLTNHLSFKHPRVTTIKIGDDVSWSSNLKKGIERIDAGRIFFFFEDAFISSKISSNDILNFLNFAKEYDTDYLRLKRTQKPNSRIIKNIGILNQGDLYRMTLFLSIIKKEVLLDIIYPTENAWEFEFNGSVRSDKYCRFYSVYKDFIFYNHAVIKGKWTPTAVPIVEKFGLNVMERGIIEDVDTSIINRIKRYILLDLIPAKYQRKVLQFFQKL